MISDRKYNNIPPQIKNFEMVISILMHFWFKLEHCKPHKGKCHPTKYTIINENFRQYIAAIYCRKFLMLSNQMSHYIASALELGDNCIQKFGEVYRWI